MKTKVLITGSNGFVGQSLISFLKDEYDVYGFDRSLSRNLKPENSFIGDLGDFELVREIFEKILPDVVIHLAAIVHKNNVDTSAGNYDFVNFECSKQLFNLAKKFDSKIIFSSTIEVYGENNFKVITEETVCNPKSYYAKSKLDAENYLKELGNVNYIILRFTPLYGENFTLNIDKRVFLKKNKIAYYFKNGNYTFDFCSINNVCETIKYFSTNDFENNCYLLSDNEHISVKKIIDIKKKSGYKIYTVHLPYHLCLISIKIMELISSPFKKKDIYFSQRNFKKLFVSKEYDCNKLNKVVSLDWNFEKTILREKNK